LTVPDDELCERFPINTTGGPHQIKISLTGEAICGHTP
jgi:hypothetical protein